MKERLKAKFSQIFGLHEESATTDPPPRLQSSKRSNAIGGLPNELLTCIFIFNAERTSSSFLDVLSISHVCSLWRTIALNCPELWRRYAFLHSKQGSRGEDFSRALLERCGDLTLDVGWERLSDGYRASSSKSNQHLTLELECDTIHRFRSYSAIVTAFQVEKMTAFLKNAPPIETIEELTLDSGDRFSRRDFPHEIFSKEIPSLKIVCLRSCWLDLSWMRMDNLRTLSVTVAPHVLPWTADEWMSFLGGCLNLTHFHLNMPFPFIGTMESIPDANTPMDVSLPSLTHLDFKIPFFRMRHFLLRLSLPAIRRVSLSMAMYTGPEDEPGILLIVQRFIAPFLSSNGNRLYVGVVDGATSIAIGFSPMKDYAPGENYLSDSVRVQVVVADGRVRQAGATRFLSHIWRDLSETAPSITSLCASMRSEESGYQEFEAFLSQATSLHTLHEPGHAMLVSLVKKPTLLPALEKVVYALPPSFLLDSRFQDLTLESLRHFASERRARGYPMKVAEFHFPKGTPLNGHVRDLIEKDGIAAIVFY